MNKFLTGLLIFILLFTPVVVFAADAETTDASTLTAKLMEIKKVYFQWRIATLVYNTAALHSKVGQKLMSTEDADMPEGAMRVLRDYIKSLRPKTNDEVNAWFSTKLPQMIKAIYQRLANNLALKLENLNGELSLQIFDAVEAGNTLPLDEMLVYLGKQRGIASTAFTGTLFVLDTKLAFEARYAKENAQSKLVSLSGDIRKLHKKFEKIDTRQFDQKMVNNVAKMTNTRLWRWLAQAILVETQDTPSKIEWKHMIDINKATAQDLMNIPGVAATTAQKILAYRKAHGMITSVNELNQVKGIGFKTLRRIKTVCYVGEFQYPQKEVTVLCYFNGDNDLELSSMLAINTFEKIGSTDRMNIVCQIDRVGQEVLAAKNQGDADSWFDGNWTSARRYLIQKDNVPFQLGSVLMEKMGEVDMGRPESLIEFVQWGVDHFPAKRYVLIICNHGSEFGIGGVSFDETDDNHFDTIELGSTIKAVNNVIKANTGRDKFSSLIFDCCLLGNTEVLAQLRDEVHSVFACENVQITWYDYDKFFKAIDENPAASPREVAKAFLVAYCDSMKGGEMVLNATAYDMDQFDVFYTPFKDFAATVNNYVDTAPDAVKRALEQMTSINGTTVFDIIHFATLLEKEGAANSEVTAVSRKLIESWGEPTGTPAGFTPKHYPEGHLVISEAHNELEPTAHGMSIHFNDKSTWAAIAKDHSQGEVMTPEWIEKWTASWMDRFPYRKLRFSLETEWDEFLIKTLSIK